MSKLRYIKKKKSSASIMLVGEYMWPWYQEACALALEKFGFTVERFKWFNDFHKWLPGVTEPIYHSFWHRFQYRFHQGPIVWSLNARLMSLALGKRPDIIWFYNVHLITPRTIRKLKKLLPNTCFVQYANDNPFSLQARPSLWKNFLKNIPLFDLHFAYRKSNLVDYKNYGAKSVHLLRSYFIPDEDYPVENRNIPERFKCDVVFAGHYENDGRVEMLEEICKAGYHLNLFGGGWDKALSRLSPCSPLRSKFPIVPVTNDEYRYAICGAKVALCFLSKLNIDTYTRRNFQIPAMKTAMLSEWSEDLSGLFKENVECNFFKNKNELLQKLKKLLADNNYRKKISINGYKKVYKSKHDINNRISYFLDHLKKIN